MKVINANLNEGGGRKSGGKIKKIRLSMQVKL